MSIIQPPLISVVIPTCHRNDLLAKCLDCLAPGTQALPPEWYEVIVTDDGSRTTAQALVAERYPWAQWVAGPRRGPAANRNSGAKLAQGEWLAFTDDDCLPRPGWLEAYHSAIQEGTFVYEGKTTCEEGLCSPLLEAPLNLTGGNLWSCNFFISAQTLDAAGGFDENFAMPAMEDTDLKERLAADSEAIIFVGRAVVDHPPRRQRGGRRLGERYEANVQYWYKTGHDGPFLISYLKHIKHRAFCIRKFPAGLDYCLAFASLVTEIAFVLPRLSLWEKKHRTFYRSVQSSATSKQCSQEA